MRAFFGQQYRGEVLLVFGSDGKSPSWGPAACASCVVYYANNKNRSGGGTVFL